MAKPAAPRFTAPSQLSRPARDPNATEPEDLDAAAEGQFGRRAAWTDRRRQPRPKQLRGENGPEIGARDAASAPDNTSQVSDRLAVLAELSLAGLRLEWRQLFRADPPRLSRDIMLRAIAYRLQEVAHGGVSKVTQRRLMTLTAEFERAELRRRQRPRSNPARASFANGMGEPTRSALPTSASRFQGTAYRSLTKIARHITGAQWSGPRFFSADEKVGDCDSDARQSLDRRGDASETQMVDLRQNGSPARAKVRCAVYTRKSSEEGLEQEFNSLDAQREACEAYITSQKHEGWTVLATFYDDGAYSGGTMERPALQRLLDDVRTGKIDVVVVYKVDRLTRSLADFAKIVEIFDAQRVSFVSVTQAFNTTTGMGRLTLNVLLSFAQFEREVTGEQIRDKIAASKKGKKGMWMGGQSSLGYDADS